MTDKRYNELRKQAMIGARLMQIAFVFGFLETWYFGWNQKPASVAELVCDFICLFVAFTGCFAFGYSITAKMISDIKDLYNGN